MRDKVTHKKCFSTDCEGQSHKNLCFLLIVRDKVTRNCVHRPRVSKREASRSGIEPRSFLLTSLKRLTAEPNQLALYLIPSPTITTLTEPPFLPAPPIRPNPTPSRPLTWPNLSPLVSVQVRFTKRVDKRETDKWRLTPPVIALSLMGTKRSRLQVGKL